MNKRVNEKKISIELIFDHLPPPPPVKSEVGKIGRYEGEKFENNNKNKTPDKENTAYRLRLLPCLRRDRCAPRNDISPHPYPLPQGERKFLGARNDKCCSDNKNKYTYFLRRSLRIPKDSDIAELLPQFAAKGLALWHDNTYGGKVIDDYRIIL